MTNSLTLPDKTFLEGVFSMDNGHVLDFSKASFKTFFAELNIEIYDESKYPNDGPSGSKANRLRSFWRAATDQEVALSLTTLADHIEAKRAAQNPFAVPAYPSITNEHLKMIRKIGKKLNSNITPKINSNVTNVQSSSVTVTSETQIAQNKIQIEIHEDIYYHIKRYLDTKDYYHAVEESFKLVRAKLKEITGNEKASDAFNQANYEKIFGRMPRDDIEKDFFEAVKFLNMSIQFLRNEKVHTPATPIEENLALSYISLASLVYNLITQYVDPVLAEQIEEAVTKKRTSYKNVNTFYKDFATGNWLKDFESQFSMSHSLKKSLKNKWVKEANFALSWNHTNIDLMRLELVSAKLTVEDIDKLINLPTIDKFGNNQQQGLLEFLQYIDSKYPDKISKIAKDYMKNLNWI